MFDQLGLDFKWLLAVWGAVLTAHQLQGQARAHDDHGHHHALNWT